MPEAVAAGHQRVRFDAHPAETTVATTVENSNPVLVVAALERVRERALPVQRGHRRPGLVRSAPATAVATTGPGSIVPASAIPSSTAATAIASVVETVPTGDVADSAATNPRAVPVRAIGSASTIGERLATANPADPIAIAATAAAIPAIPATLVGHGATAETVRQTHPTMRSTAPAVAAIAARLVAVPTAAHLVAAGSATTATVVLHSAADPEATNA